MPSEDPFHSGQYGVAYTKGLQWGNDTRYTKAIGALKHYTIYSVENSGGKNGGSEGFSRGSDYFEIAMKDIEETYLPQFKAPVVEACAYPQTTFPLSVLFGNARLERSLRTHLPCSVLLHVASARRKLRRWLWRAGSRWATCARTRR